LTKNIIRYGDDRVFNGTQNKKVVTLTSHYTKILIYIVYFK